MKRRLVLAAPVLAMLPIARASEAAMQAAVLAFTGGVAPVAGAVHLEMAELVENGNAVPVRVWCEQPARALALFTPLNPEPEVIHAHFGPAAARAEFTTRMRLARSQRVQAVALLADGRCWQRELDVVVTLAACVE